MRTLNHLAISELRWERLELVRNPDTREPLAMRWLRILDGLRVIESFTERDGLEWLHVSFSFPTHIPQWAEIRDVKDVFFGPHAHCYMVFPEQTEYVNDNPYVLHLFGLSGGARMLPDFRTEIEPGRFTI